MQQYQRCSASVRLIINANVATLTVTQQKLFYNILAVITRRPDGVS